LLGFKENLENLEGKPPKGQYLLLEPNTERCVNEEAKPQRGGHKPMCQNPNKCVLKILRENPKEKV